MREKTNINQSWSFIQDGKSQVLDLPHTWNNIDGQDGSNGYFRGVGRYEKKLSKMDGEVYLEILGANSQASVYLNGEKLAEHKGGYSAFWAKLSGKLNKTENLLAIEVSNLPNDEVYPTMADFTFYGGIYRDVNLVKFSSGAHFDITRNQTGVYVTPRLKDGVWTVEIDVAIVGGEGRNVEYLYEIKDCANVPVKSLSSKKKKVYIEVENPQLWQGVDNPYLYNVCVSMLEDDNALDEVEIKTGFREISFSADKGCFLNGKHIKLKGVSRHQDRENKGNAITIKEHKEDLALIKEVGANSIRLAHYQQNQDFYDICDREGFLVWAEVPVISRFSKKRQDNAKSQLNELIAQCRNHTSIFCWGISNEITIAGDTKGVYAAMVELNDLAKSLDDSRLTTIAEVAMCTIDSPLNAVTDILGYNHYFGWYMGTFKELDDWLEKWRKTNPDKKLCLSEYGAEGIMSYQGDKPTQGDYSEGYQAVFHENYIKRINAADWLWGSYVWNMFDFGSAARNEGGVRGRNNKGLVSFDRKTKKDSFYLYKAYWSNEPFVYVAGNRYCKRKVGQTSIKVYSNQPSVTLVVNGDEFTQQADKVFIFDGLTIKYDKNVVVATAGDCSYRFEIEGVDELPQSYTLPEGEASMVRNWFDDSAGAFRPECFSLNDRVGSLLKNSEVKVLLKKFAGKKANSKLLYLIYPFKVKTLLKLPFIKINSEMIDIAERYLQTIKK